MMAAVEAGGVWPGCVVLVLALRDRRRRREEEEEEEEVCREEEERVRLSWGASAFSEESSE